ncbi:MAG: hypothetical protein H0T92_13520 [Pyrinomonadaceae bacterium]|nr:hypothetical protein [Pyrinomonadaceae bacterium]
MAAVAAAVLCVTSAPLNKADVVALEDAHKRVPNLRSTLRFAEKRMAAVARILYQSVPFGYGMNPVPEHSAQVPNLFMESVPAGVWRVLSLEEQRMPARHAHIFTVTIAGTHPRIVVTKEEARQGMTHPRLRSVFLEKRCAARALPMCAPLACKDAIVNAMTERGAGQSLKESSHEHGG